MREVVIKAKGRTDADVELAIDEAARKIKAGFTSGADSNDDGSYSFTVTGEEEPAEQQ